MTPMIDILPLYNELPSHYADRVGQVYAKTVTIQHKKENGQFFTPTEIARFMARLAMQTKNTLNILDPGCGTAILSSSLIESLAKQNDNLRLIELVVFYISLKITYLTTLLLNSFFVSTSIDKKTCLFLT